MTPHSRSTLKLSELAVRELMNCSASRPEAPPKSKPKWKR